MWGPWAERMPCGRQAHVAGGGCITTVRGITREVGHGTRSLSAHTHTHIRRRDSLTLLVRTSAMGSAVEAAIDDDIVSWEGGAHTTRFDV